MLLTEESNRAISPAPGAGRAAVRGSLSRALTMHACLIESNPCHIKVDRESRSTYVPWHAVLIHTSYTHTAIIKLSLKKPKELVLLLCNPVNYLAMGKICV